MGTTEMRSDAPVITGLIANLILALGKTSVGVLGHSQALLADGINSTSDVAYYIVVAVFVRLARKPADKEHPYGHRQLESIAALVVGAFVTSTAVTLLWTAIDGVYTFISEGAGLTVASRLTLWVSAATVLLKVVLYVYTSRAGRRTGNVAVTALASDHRNDIMAAAAACTGIVLARMGYAWVDPAAGGLVSLFVLRTGLQILRDSAIDLMDTVPGKPLTNRICSLVGGLPDVRGVESIFAHRFGPYFVVNITIGIDGTLSVEEGDRIASQVESLLTDNIEMLRTVHVHYHPWRPSDGPREPAIVCADGLPT